MPTPEVDGVMDIYCQVCGYFETHSLSYEEWRGMTGEELPKEDYEIILPLVSMDKVEIYDDVYN